MNATNKTGKTKGAIKKAPSKNASTRTGKSYAGVGKVRIGRKAGYENGGETKYVVRTVSVTSRLRAIGNSRGVILNSQLIEAARLNDEADIVIKANDGVITIIQLKGSEVNTDLSTWDKQFKAAMKKGAKPDDDLFEGMANDFDSKEW